MEEFFYDRRDTFEWLLSAKLESATYESIRRSSVWTGPTTEKLSGHSAQNGVRVKMWPLDTRKSGRRDGRWTRTALMTQENATGIPEGLLGEQLEF